MIDLRSRIHRYTAGLRQAARTKRGKDILTFGVFLAIAAVLWIVLSLNEEDQVDLRMPLRIEHLPDSVTIVSTPPDFVNVSMRARRSDLLKSRLGTEPAIRVDWRTYHGRRSVELSSAELKTLARNAVSGASIIAVTPDSLNLLYTTGRGRKLPVALDYQVTPGPQVAMLGKPRVSPDSVLVYAIGSASSGLTAVATEPIRIAGLSKTTTMRVRLACAPRTRNVPDSVDVTFAVEPLIMKTRRVVIEPVNVPSGVKLITFPAQVEVSYMLPASVYKHSSPQFRVVADYRNIDHSASTHNIRLRLVDVDERLQNVYLSADSAEYIIEHR
ncbi:MAG: hypothetical protein K2M12_08350 [Muribaculaceae bacterium]|nr:hypothetical protein [Muribaculaceae bacterium]